jgi:hypothetical protein
LSRFRLIVHNPVVFYPLDQLHLQSPHMPGFLDFFLETQQLAEERAHYGISLNTRLADVAVNANPFPRAQLLRLRCKLSHQL